MVFITSIAIAQPETTYVFTLSPKIPEATMVLNNVFGVDSDKLAKLDTAPDEELYKSADSKYELRLIKSDGFFDFSKPSAIPTHYRSEGEGERLPPPSKQQGKYTAQEADELCRNTLHHIFGIPPDILEASRIIHENPAKERSRAYRIYYNYVLGGLPLIPISATTRSPYIEVGVTDDGMVYARGVSIGIEKMEPNTQQVLSKAEMIERNPWMQSFGTHQLSYYLKPGENGLFTTEVVWYAYDLESWFSGHVYDASTGKQFLVE